MGDLLLALLVAGAVAVVLDPNAGARKKLAALRFLAAAPVTCVLMLPPDRAARLFAVQVQAARWN